MNLNSSLLRRFRKTAHARSRIYCLPFAGGSASAYFEWASVFTDLDVVAIQLPGRQDRIDDQPFESISNAASAIAEEICDEANELPFGIFGHSMGALLAFETINRLPSQGEGKPSLAVFSGRAAPHLAKSDGSNFHTSSDEQLIELMLRFGAAPMEIKKYPELLESMIPTFRADLKMIDTYQYMSFAKISVPVLAVSGEQDPFVDINLVRSWQELTTSTFEFRSWPGGHFFIWNEQNQLLADIRRLLRPTGDLNPNVA